MTTTDLQGISPDFSCHELRVQACTKNSPPEPSVDLYTFDIVDRRRLGSIDQLTPAQARTYARMILAAADAAENKLPETFPITLTTTGMRCPECRDGKCRNCDGCAWDTNTDQPTNCACSLAGH